MWKNKERGEKIKERENLRASEVSLTFTMRKDKDKDLSWWNTPGGQNFLRPFVVLVHFRFRKDWSETELNAWHKEKFKQENSTPLPSSSTNSFNVQSLRDRIKCNCNCKRKRSHSQWHTPLMDNHQQFVTHNRRMKKLKRKMNALSNKTAASLLKVKVTELWLFIRQSTDTGSPEVNQDRHCALLPALFWEIYWGFVCSSHFGQEIFLVNLLLNCDPAETTTQEFSFRSVKLNSKSDRSVFKTPF